MSDMARDHEEPKKRQRNVERQNCWFWCCHWTWPLQSWPLSRNPRGVREAVYRALQAEWPRAESAATYSKLVLVS